jgi:thiol-disulfide isomerase/thioredoxin
MEEIIGDDCFKTLDLSQYLIFYFTASWCGPCQKIAPEIVNLSNELDPDKIRFFKIDIDEDDNNEICEKCEIKSVPSFLLFKKRTYIDRVQGASIGNIKEMIINNVTSDNK